MSAEDTRLFESLLSGLREQVIEDVFPFYPLSSPGMPLPGPDFVIAAQRLGDAAPVLEGKGATCRLVSHGSALEYLYRRALYDEDFHILVDVKGRQINAPCVPGHLWGDDTAGFNGGPKPATVMVIGKNPGDEEVRYKRNFVGPTSEEFSRCLLNLGIREQDTQDWYITNLVKWPTLDPRSGALPASHVKDCLPLLHEELRLVKPDFILCLGSEASKALLGTPYSVSNMAGRVVPLTFPVHDVDEEPMYRTAKVMTATHPAAVYRRPELTDEFTNQLGLFWQLSQGADIGNDERDIDHRVVYTERALAKLVDEILADPDPASRVIAVDAEWHGDHPEAAVAYLRTVQFSHKSKFACCVVLRHQGGEAAFKPTIGHAIKQLRRLCKSTPARRVRIGGHFFRADLPWLIHAGLDLREEYTCDQADPRLGGWDTSLQYHACNETARYKLEEVAVRLTTASRYDAKLQAWRKNYCAKRKIDAEELEGYGEAPAWILHPDPNIYRGVPNYACYDADVTRRITERLSEPGGLLDSDWFGNNSWRPFWVSHRASPAFLEMEMNGILIDKDRADELARTFILARDCLVDELRREVNWPAYNPGSHPQNRALLFGDRYGYKLDKDTGEKLPIKPAAAQSLNLQPVKCTGKRPRLWVDLLSRGETEHNTASTDKESLGILGHVHPVARKLRDIKFLTTVLQSVLRRPKTDRETGELLYDEDGNYIYAKGLLGAIGHDGRVRTHLSQVKETGRAASYRPPLQNLSKRREDDYKRILGYIKDGQPKGDYLHIFGEPLYKHPLRSILRAAPGCVLIEADYTGAELAILAWMCQDQTMIEHVRRNGLPESHPDHYDIHSRQAVAAFGLQGVVPTKTGMKLAGVPGLRVAAKNVNFGIPYGRGPEAIARQCAEEGVNITAEQAQILIDLYFQVYPGTGVFLQDCRQRSQEPGWMMNFAGRLRRFFNSSDQQVQGEQERQAQNFPIQSGVADAMSRALDHLYYYRHNFPSDEVYYKLLLQIHDAVLLEVPVKHIAFVRDEVLPRCMRELVPVMPARLDGTAITDLLDPYHLDIDKELFVHWGEGITAAEAAELGLPAEYVH